jgi:hypothetical protein
MRTLSCCGASLPAGPIAFDPAASTLGFLKAGRWGRKLGSEGAITVYGKGQSKPRLTIPGPGYYGIAVDSKGDIFSAFVGGTVDAYRPGAKKPYETIGGFDSSTGVAIDSKNNVWVAEVPTASAARRLTASLRQISSSNRTSATAWWAKNGAKTPFSTIVGNSDPLGIASCPLVKK